ncbi:MAG: AAA family ATPase [Chloroflexi bacterium]|jgi:MoxR-like ATPase|nr:AAA family ATPase [Chloroflexota bacterium]MAZ63956.1 AAA family ATPase [Dehalococcoidia bacterium]MEE3004134.1 MoxR family ATPase [Chloroflexota bacterium]HAI09878.1 AAA family ATPase [Dehalococcoidia bacterium]HAJ01227.1 AAA family ATPase [Dehalococcoidia bacterium]|tara:strand:- start:9179 stop:10147 length:969 start_codon:yes stop_codon:yes gene_type:complete
MTQRETLTPETSGSVSQAAANIKDNIERVLVGKGGVIELTLAAVLSSGHILIEDVPGIGKTTLARTLASSLDCTFQRIQFTPDLMPSDITGINYYNQKSGEFEFRPGPIIAQIVLADEINRATPRTQSALLEAMAERQLTVDDITITLPVPFLVIATQNPIELEGTFPLPEAQLDRFMLRLRLGYPTEDEEEAMLTRFQTADPLNDLAAVVGASDITELQETVRQVHLDPVLRNYLVQLVQATRTHADVELGASPRATLGLYRCSQALAAIRGRDYVTPDDLKTLAPLALSHRMILRSQARLRERTPESVIDEILAQIQVPV